jgi:hypothetical protein
VTGVTLRAQALDRLLDDASQFPPGNQSLKEAVANHALWRHDPHSRVVGRFLLPTPRAGTFADMLTGDAQPEEKFELGLVAPGDMPGRAAGEVARMLGGAGVVTAVEVPMKVGGAAIAAWQEAFPQAELFIECGPVDIPAIKQMGGRLKVRCGGLHAAAVPSVRLIAEFIYEAVALSVPFKATAGLHQPLRHFDGQLGVDVHGFLNLWVATARAQGGASRREIEEPLTSRDLASLAPMDEDLQAARSLFMAFGTCSLREPLAALTDLGILDV